MGFKKKTQNGFRWDPGFTKIQPKPGPGPTRLYIYIVTKIPSCIYSYNPKILIASPHTLISSVASQVSSLQLTLSCLNLTQFQVSTLNLNSSIQFPRKPSLKRPRQSSLTSPATIKHQAPRQQAQPPSRNSKPSWTTPHSLQTHNWMGLGFFFFFFSFRVFVSKIWVWVLFLWAKFVGIFFFLVCFVGGIFKFANFISKFTKFLGFVGFFVQIGLLDLGIRLDAKKMLFCDDLWFWVCIDFFVCDFGPGPTGSDGVGLGATTKNLFIKWAGFG